ncbi:hypothetical protein BD779DRAFT_1045544 [Infundibulicybe gibba]|nr:hypothetical protein BD779DRAFT_1045544 [Infundibulicybe gibba]
MHITADDSNADSWIHKTVSPTCFSVGLPGKGCTCRSLTTTTLDSQSACFSLIFRLHDLLPLASSQQTAAQADFTKTPVSLVVIQIRLMGMRSTVSNYCRSWFRFEGTWLSGSGPGRDGLIMWCDWELGRIDRNGRWADRVGNLFVPPVI